MQVQQDNQGEKGRATGGGIRIPVVSAASLPIKKRNLFPRRNRVNDLLWVGLVTVTIVVGGLLLSGTVRSVIGVVGLVSLVLLSVTFVRRDLVKLQKVAMEHHGYAKTLDRSFRSLVHPFLPLLVAAITALVFFGPGASTVSIALCMLFGMGHFGVGLVLKLLVHPADSVERRTAIDAAAITALATLVLLFGLVLVMPVVAGQLIESSGPTRVTLTMVASYFPLGVLSLMWLAYAVAHEVLRRRR